MTDGRRLVRDDCPFCDIITGTAPAKMHAAGATYIIIDPLDPVTEGHLLVIPRDHVADAVEHPSLTGYMMEVAAKHATPLGPCNLITSVGASATQSVWHLHIHIVPRRFHDGLQLPWGTNEQHYRDHMSAALEFYGGA